MASSKQRQSVDKRVGTTCLTNSKQDTFKGVVVNTHAAICLAFSLGIRAGLASPYLAAEYMARYIADHTMPDDETDLGVLHERAMRAIIRPLTYTAEEFENMTEVEVDDDEGNGTDSDER
jgi:hypothetical protein